MSVVSKTDRFDLWFKTQSDRASALVIADEEFARHLAAFNER